MLSPLRFLRHCVRLAWGQREGHSVHRGPYLWRHPQVQETSRLENVPGYTRVGPGAACLDRQELWVWRRTRRDTRGNTRFLQCLSAALWVNCTGQKVLVGCQDLCLGLTSHTGLFGYNRQCVIHQQIISFFLWSLFSGSYQSHCQSSFTSARFPRKVDKSRCFTAGHHKWGKYWEKWLSCMT